MSQAAAQRGGGARPSAGLTALVREEGENRALGARLRGGAGGRRPTRGGWRRRPTMTPFTIYLRPMLLSASPGVACGGLPSSALPQMAPANGACVRAAYSPWGGRLHAPGPSYRAR